MIKIQDKYKSFPQYLFYDSVHLQPPRETFQEEQTSIMASPGLGVRQALYMVLVRYSQ
jgi:hypothetical protein